ncbi:hypothetical protein MMC13_008385 [Lambiella insularis]|nr:hypothetical protein [Lambiella insularis]
MSDARDYLLTVDRDKTEAEHIAAATASKLESKQLTFINVVQSLGEYINDEDATIRSRAINYLSEVIRALTPIFLTRQQIQVLCQFLCDRIEDGGAVSGLAKLQELGRFGREMAIMTLRALLQHFQDLQLRPQYQRLEILELLYCLMSNHRSSVKSLGNESLTGIQDLVSGEKDPRNLMIIFSLLKVIMVEWDIVEHAETLFDAVFCYFPITFKPPPDDLYGITAEDLKSRLRDCIAASCYFAPYAFPQLLDKLDSTSPTVKRDVLQTIAACAESYDISTMSKYSVTLWDSLKFEILNVQEEDVGVEAMLAIKAVAVRLSRDLSPTDPKTPLATYIRPIMKECKEHLQEPQSKQAKRAGQILESLGTASPAAFSWVAKSVVPRLLNLYQEADSVATQRAFLEVLLKVMEPALIYYGPTSILVDTGTGNPLEPFKNQLFEVFSQALMNSAIEEVSLHIIALKCLQLICLLRKYLQDNEIGMAVQYFDEILISEDTGGQGDLKNAAIMALVGISRIKPNLILDITFPAFMAKLPDLDIQDSCDYGVVLEALARISVEQVMSDTLIRRLFSRLELVLQSPRSSAYSQAILSTLYYVFKQRDMSADANLNFYFEKIVSLVNQTARASVESELPTGLVRPQVMETLGRLASYIVRSLDSHKQIAVGQQVYTLFCDASEFVPVPFREKVPETQRGTMILSTYLVAAIQIKVPLPYGYPDSSVLLHELVKMALHEDSNAIRQSLLQHIALLVNKFVRNDSLESVTNVLWEPSTGLLEKPILSYGSIRVSFWIAKALVLRLATADKILHHLLELLTHDTYGTAAARGFALLLAPDEIVAKENGAVIRLLATQKVFNHCIREISVAFRLAEPRMRSNYLIALAGILRYTATEVMMPELMTLLPLLLQSLDLEDQDVKAASIKTLTAISQRRPEAAQEHVSSIISRLLKIAADRRINSPVSTPSA